MSISFCFLRRSSFLVVKISFCYFSSALFFLCSSSLIYVFSLFSSLVITSFCSSELAIAGIFSTFLFFTGPKPCTFKRGWHISFNEQHAGGSVISEKELGGHVVGKVRLGSSAVALYDRSAFTWVLLNQFHHKHLNTVQKLMLLYGKTHFSYI